MTSAFLIKLHPAGPWRYGPGEGGRDSVDALYRSDRLFSAVTLAFHRLGLLESWLDATVRAETPAVVFSSLFPFQGETLFVTPPASLWPPPPAALRISSPVFSTKVRWRAARFVPLALVESLLMGQRLLAEQWTADAESRCLLRRDRPQSSPFRTVLRTQAAIDRQGAGAEGHSLACVEFEAGSGLWTVARFDSESAQQAWGENLRAAFRLLADSGFGGRRSSGWGQVSKIEISDGTWPALLLQRRNRAKKNGSNPSPGNGDAASSQHWLLSLFSPAATDAVNWSAGTYSLIVRGGHVESSSGSGAAKKLARMLEEGSVIEAPQPPRGSAVDVAPDGFSHPVYRAGFALSIPLPEVEFSSSADENEYPGAELERALDEALKAAAEQQVIDTPSKIADEAVERFERATEELSQPAVEASESREEEVPAESQDEERLTIRESQSEERSISESQQEAEAVGHALPTPVPEEPSPTTTDVEVPERLSIEDLPTEELHAEDSHPEESHSEDTPPEGAESQTNERENTESEPGNEV